MNVEQIYKIKEPFTLALSVDEMIEGANEMLDKEAKELNEELNS